MAVMMSGCSTPTLPTVGDDEMVGRPADAGQTTDSPPPRSGALWYRLQPGDDSINVRMRLLNPPSTATFFLPGSWAGSDFDDLIRIGYARGPDHSLAMSLDRSQGRVDIDAGDSDWVELYYEIDTLRERDEEHRFFPWMKDEAFFAYAPTILVLPSAGISRQLRDIPIEVHLPPDWTVTATWPMHRAPVEPSEQPIAGFVADDIRSLRDAFIAAARDWETVEALLPQGVLTLTLVQPFAFDTETFLDDAAAITAEYLDQFGSYDHISAIIMDLPQDAPQTLRGTGRRGGFVLEIPTEQPLDADLRLLLAHEAFHMWNGHRIVPDGDTHDDVQWFKEGVTHYIALKSLARLGLIDERATRRELALAGQYYLQNPLVAGGQVRPIDRTRFPYDRGVLIALALDVSLYHHSDGQSSVEDWIALLLSPDFAEQARAYDLDTLDDSFQHLIDDIDPQLFHRYQQLVHSSEPIDVNELFRSLGLHFLQTRHGNRSRLLPIDEQSEPFEALFEFSSPTPR